MPLIKHTYWFMCFFFFFSHEPQLEIARRVCNHEWSSTETARCPSTAVALPPHRRRSITGRLVEPRLVCSWSIRPSHGRMSAARQGLGSRMRHLVRVVWELTNSKNARRGRRLWHAGPTCQCDNCQEEPPQWAVVGCYCIATGWLLGQPSKSTMKLSQAVFSETVELWKPRSISWSYSIMDLPNVPYSSR